jgi:flagellar hook-associated protein 1 FlgK
MRAFEIGLSSLRAQQQTLSVLGNNLSNAATPGYHRQRVELDTRFPLRDDDLHVGTGVDVTRIARLRNSAVETALLRNLPKPEPARRRWKSTGRLSRC